MLILTEADILTAIDLKDLLLSAEKALLLQESGGFCMPDRMHIEHEGHVHLLMPAYEKEFGATKLVSVYPDNRKVNKPSIHGTVVLQDNLTGEPVALLNGTVLTALRTGAAGALGLAYTTPKSIETLGLVGAGVQGFHQVLFASAVRNIRRILVFDPYSHAKEEFIKRLTSSLPFAKIEDSRDITELVRESEAVITATTSLSPVIPDNADLIRGKHFIGIGSYRPEMREYPDSLFSQVRSIIIDTPLATKESGDLAYPLNKGLIREDEIITLGKLINGSVTIDVSGTTLFKSVGMALFDLMAAKAVYKNARRKGIGQETKI